jgi:hypothetical protein
MTAESKRLRNRAADQLRQGRRAKLRGAKEVHNARAASLKEMANNEEWLSGEPLRSQKRKPKR